MKNLLFVFCNALVFVFACGSKEIGGEKCFPYPPTILPADTTELWIGDGLPEKDTILIICEGGPKTHLDFEVEGRTSWEYLPRFKHYYRAHLHQAQTFNKKIYEYKNEFTADMAEVEVSHTSDILNRAIRYFKKRNKTVIVIGHSYGAFVIPHYLANHPNMADKYIISAGRINADSLQTEYFLKGINKGFREDGKTLNPPGEDDEPRPGRSDRYYKIYRVKQLLKGTIGREPFSELLTDVDLSNVIYIYAINDQNVGALTQKEIEFLQSKNAEIHATETGHYDNWKRIVDKVRSGEIIL